MASPPWTRSYAGPLDPAAPRIDIGVAEGRKHDSSIHCDALVSLPKSALTDYVGTLSAGRIAALRQALRVALAVE